MAAAAERHGEHPLFVLEKGLITQAEFLERLEAELRGAATAWTGCSTPTSATWSATRR